jgi:hypothetical protein
MEAEDLFDAIGCDRAPGIGQDRGDPARLAGLFGRVDVGVTPSQIGHHEPGERGAEDEPHDEQPPVELGVHRVAAGLAVREKIMRGPV